MNPKPFEDEKHILPEFPRTKHLPWWANAARDDLIATEKECAVIFKAQHVTVEEKVDGANCGVARGPIIRNRNHVLRKGYAARTAGKEQWNPIWNWYYEHAGCFDDLARTAGPVSVFAEWLLMRHTVAYDLLPSFFMAFDLYDYDVGQYLDPQHGRQLLVEAGFDVVPLLHVGPVESPEQLAALATDKSRFSSTEMREGVYIKVSDGEYITHRFKMVHPGFVPGEHLDRRKLTKNKLRK